MAKQTRRSFCTAVRATRLIKKYVHFLCGGHTIIIEAAIGLEKLTQMEKGMTARRQTGLSASASATAKKLPTTTQPLATTHLLKLFKFD